MTRIGLLSDTHAYWDEKYLEYFESCDEIWHAGDIGSVEVAEKLAAFRPLRAVYGNIDGQEIRKMFPQVNRFTVDGAEVLIKHIGGYPGKYDPSVIGSLMARPPKLFISGHSHILKVKYDKTLDMLHINPGAAGMSGFHKVRTMVRFVIDNERSKTSKLLNWQDRFLTIHFVTSDFFPTFAHSKMNNSDDNERNYSGRWKRHSSLSAFQSDFQTNHACIRQADDLLSAVYAYAGRDTGGLGHLYSA